MNRARNIILIGSGNVATHLGLKLSNFYNISQVYSRQIKNANKLARLLEAEAINDIEEIKKADLAIIAIKDSVVIDTLKKIKDIPIIHTSGSLSINIFKDEFSSYGVLYPLQTFNQYVEVDLSSTPICIEANTKKMENMIIEIGSKISNNIIHMNSGQRKKLHIAAVFSCNFSNHMFAISEEILEKSNIDFSIMLPLIKQTISKLSDNKAKAVQTGPARRKDKKIIHDHIKNIDDQDVKIIYEIISNHIINTYE